MHEFTQLSREVRVGKMSESSIERRIEFALRPGKFIPGGGSFDFTEGLDHVRKTIAALLPKEAKRAVGLYETFLAGCVAKTEE